MKKLAFLVLISALAACAPTSPDLSAQAKNFQDGMTTTRVFVPSSPEASLPGEKQVSPLRQKQFVEAQNVCEAKGIRPSIGAAGSIYWHCVNAYLWPRYRWQAALNPDGSLHVIVHRAGYRPGYFF